LIRTANTSRINKSKLDEEKACEESSVTFKDYHQKFQQIYLVVSIIQAWGMENALTSATGCMKDSLENHIPLLTMIYYY
jgi:hypothetical protein